MKREKEKKIESDRNGNYPFLEEKNKESDKKVEDKWRIMNLI